MATIPVPDELTDDEKHLAELGYKQELHRSWSGFSNFAISFSIISILAGCFTSFFLGWNNGGPAAIAWGWPIVSLFILVIGLCMSELVSAYPTSGGIYWWASKLGGAKAGFYTGWLNLIGLIAIVASVAYGCATFLDITIGVFDSNYTSGNLNRVFLYFVVILVIAALVNIFSSHLLAMINNVSVWWHVFGAAAIILILILVPSHHASVGDVFTKVINNSGVFGGSKGIGFILFILPISAILTQYTITGYDASAHLSEETKSAANSAARGIWQSILYSAIGGWILLLALLFAVQDSDKISTAGGSAGSIIGQALNSGWGGTILLISTAGQFFCTMACLTSSSRMLFAFSRDRAIPGARYWSKLSSRHVPAYGVMLSATVAAIITLPALVPVDINGVASPVAFGAVVSIGVVGLYVAFAIPIFLRWRKGDAFQVGKWNLGRNYRWMSIVAVVEIVITSIIAIFPYSLGGMPWDPSFSWKFVNYTPLLVGGVLILLWIYWHLSVKHWFTGPKTTVDLPAGVSTAQEIDIEKHGTAAREQGTGV